MIDTEELRATLLTIIGENPEKVNPISADGETCLYDDGNGNHCLIGEAMVRLGIPLPENDRKGAYWVLLDHATDNARSFAGQVQARADSMDDFGHALPVPWGTLRTFVEGRGK